MMKSILKQAIILNIILLSVLGCLDSPDRKNPFDPNSQSFDNTGAISGQVLSYYAPFTPIPGTEVVFEPGGFAAVSNADGEFVLQNMPPDSYTMRVSKDGFADTSLAVTVSLGEPTPVQINLNGLPTFESISVTSRHVSRTFPASDLFFLEATAEADDPDGFNDVELLRLEIPHFGFVDTLSLTQTPGVYSIRILESELNIGSLSNLLGHPIFLIAHDRPGSRHRSEAQFVARIIERTPQTESPDERELVSTSTPTLTWRAVELPFSFRYRVEVLSVDFGVVTPVWSLTGIDSSQTSITVAEPLVPGDYNWAVSIVDDFGNWSRSQEASFRIN